MQYFGYARSTSSHRVRIALNLKGVSAEYVPVDLRTDAAEQKKPAYLSVNPQAMVPAIVHEGHVLTQSLAIIEWLEEKFPEPRFLPRKPEDRAAVRAFALAISSDIQPLQNQRVLNYLRKEHGCDEDAIASWCRQWIGQGLTACEALLARSRQQGPFCFGEQPGLADIVLVPQLHAARRFEVDLEPMVRIRQAGAAALALPAFADAEPERQQDWIA